MERQLQAICILRYTFVFQRNYTYIVNQESKLKTARRICIWG